MPYASRAQQRKFHALLRDGKIDASTVKEFDNASKGLGLPDKAGKHAAFFYGVKLAVYAGDILALSAAADLAGGGLGAYATHALAKRNPDTEKDRVARAITGFNAGVDGVSALTSAYATHALQEDPLAFSKMVRNALLTKTDGNISDAKLRAAQGLGHVGQLVLTGLTAGNALRSGLRSVGKFRSALDPKYRPVNPEDPSDVEDAEKLQNASFLHRHFGAGAAPDYNDPNFRERSEEDPPAAKALRPYGVAGSAALALGYPAYKLRGSIGSFLRNAAAEYMHRRNAGRDAANAAFAMAPPQLVSGLGKATVNAGKLIF